MGKANRLLTLFYLGIALGYFMPVEAIIALSIIGGIFWMISFIILLIEED